MIAELLASGLLPWEAIGVELGGGRCHDNMRERREGCRGGIWGRDLEGVGGVGR